MKNNSFYVNISKIIVAHKFTLNKNNKCAYPKGRKYYGLIYCISGEAEYCFSSKKCIKIKKGDVFLLSPHASYSIVVKEEFIHYTVNFEINDDFSIIDFSNDSFYLIVPKTTEIYYHKFKETVAQWNSNKFSSEMLATAQLYELLAILISEIYENNYNVNMNLLLQPAKEYIDNNFKKNITLDVLANISNMSVSNFRREWLKLYKESALQYRDKIRLRYSKEYLNSGFYTVSEIASKCGFSDVNYFIRFFKKHTGISPGKYKKTFYV